MDKSFPIRPYYFGETDSYHKFECIERTTTKIDHELRMIEFLRQKFPESEIKADDPKFHAGNYPYHNIWTDGLEEAK